MVDVMDDLMKLWLAVLLGALIGLNRDMHGKPTGVRLHALVASGTCALVLATVAYSDVAGVTRVIQGIIGGIGFLGAGVIMHGAGLLPRSGTALAVPAPQGGPMQIHHLTTAGTIWVTAALGIICGLGMWRLALAMSATILVILVVGIRIDRGLFGKLGRQEDGGEPND